jgi:hypothetical protein
MEWTAEPLSRIQLRQYALNLRKRVGLEDTLHFPVLPFFENVMPQLFEDFEYQILCRDEMPANKHGYTDVANKIICIREDVYEGAAAGKGREGIE